jgi:hypothetical protein
MMCTALCKKLVRSLRDNKIRGVQNCEQREGLMRETTGGDSLQAIYAKFVMRLLLLLGVRRWLTTEVGFHSSRRIRIDASKEWPCKAIV